MHSDAAPDFSGRLLHCLIQLLISHKHGRAYQLV